MPDFVNRDDLMLLMEKQANYDTQPRACIRMIRVVRDFPSANAVPSELYLELLDNYAKTPAEQLLWKLKAGLEKGENLWGTALLSK